MKINDYQQSMPGAPSRAILLPPVLLVVADLVTVFLY